MNEHRCDGSISSLVCIQNSHCCLRLGNIPIPPYAYLLFFHCLCSSTALGLLACYRSYSNFIAFRWTILCFVDSFRSILFFVSFYTNFVHSFFGSLCISLAEFDRKADWIEWEIHIITAMCECYVYRKERAILLLCAFQWCHCCRLCFLRLVSMRCSNPYI